MTSYGKGRLGLEQIDTWGLAYPNGKRVWKFKSGGGAPETEMIHATDAEKFRPGAIATWQSPLHSPGCPSLSITGTIAHVDKTGTAIYFMGLCGATDLGRVVECCTLITAAPVEKEDTDEEP